MENVQQFEIKLENKSIKFIKRGAYIDLFILDAGVVEEQTWLFNEQNLELVQFLLSALSVK